MRTGLPLRLLAGAALAHSSVQASQSHGAIHPFAKYMQLASDDAHVAIATTTTATPSATPTRPLLECFQVAEPVLTPAGLTRRDISQLPALVPEGQKLIDAAPSPCAVVLMEHTFASSYGAPFVGQYTPPACDFDYVVINFTTLVKGRQYDRTGVMYLGDSEVWRTSTAEPTSYGIRWEWLKDMTAFLSLWKEPQTLIFDLENNVDSTYTGLLNTTLTASFFKVPPTSGSPKSLGSHSPADLIISISQRLGAQGMPSQFLYPQQAAITTVADFPRNANRAVFTVDVKGQGAEEFWWSNVPQSATLAFESTYGEYPGYSPFREVQVLIDGRLAGVSWPFPVIYTGGVVPQLHRPIVGIQAFDISEHEIDISPFLPLLCDGASHTFEIKIVGLVDDGGSKAELSTTTDDLWYVTGKIFVWLDDEGSITTGSFDSAEPLPPTIQLSQSLTQNATGANETLDYNLAVFRTLTISSKVTTQKTNGTVQWSQSLSYSNIGGVSGFGNNNLNDFSISGSDSTTGLGISYLTNYSYPLFANSTADFAPEGNLTLWAQVDQGLKVYVQGDAVLPTGIEGFLAARKIERQSIQGSLLDTWRNATADYYRPGDNSYSSGAGRTHQEFSFGGVGASGEVLPLYYRDVSAFNDTVTADHFEINGH